MTKEEKILKIKEELKARAARKFPGNEERQNAYVYGTINHIKEKFNHAH